MIAGAFFAPDQAIDARSGQPWLKSRTEQEMIEPQAGVAWPTLPLVIPEREHRLGWMDTADRVTPALCQQRLERRAAFRLDLCILVP